MLDVKIKQGLEALLDNVEVKATAKSSFTVETINDRIAALEKQLLDLDKFPQARLSPSWKKASDEIEYLKNLKARKGW